jgi:hypothetical protein
MTVSSSNRKMAWLWEALNHSSLATSSWSILRKWLLTRCNTNHHCGSGYVDDTFVVWPHGSEQLQNFLNHLNSLRPSTQFTMATESDSMIPFLDVLVIRKGMTLAAKVYRKPTHTGRYLNFKSNHLLYVKRGLIQSLHNRASTICQE